MVVLPALLSPSAPRHPTALSLSLSLGNPTKSSSLANSNWTNATKSTLMSSSRPMTDPSILLLLLRHPIERRHRRRDRQRRHNRRPRRRALHPAGPNPSGGPVAGHDDGLCPQEHRQLPRLNRRRQRRRRRRRRTLQHLGGAQRDQVQGGIDVRGQRFADVFVVAVRVVGPLRRAAPAIAMPSPRRSHVDVVNRPFFAPGRQIATSLRRGRSRCDNRRRAEGGKESTCLAIDQAALQSCQGDKPPGRDAKCATNIDTVRDRDASYSPSSSSSS